MIEIKQITEPLDMGGYDAAYAGQALQVWVNLPAALRRKRSELLRGLAKEIATQMKGSSRAVSWRARLIKQVQRFFATLRAWLRTTWADDMETLMSAVWSAGGDAETHWSVAEIRKLQDADPLLYAWLTRESWRMIDEWQDARKKK